MYKLVLKDPHTGFDRDYKVKGTVATLTFQTRKEAQVFKDILIQRKDYPELEILIADF